MAVIGLRNVVSSSSTIIYQSTKAETLKKVMQRKKGSVRRAKSCIDMHVLRKELMELHILYIYQY